MYLVEQTATINFLLKEWLSLAAGIRALTIGLKGTAITKLAKTVSMNILIAPEYKNYQVS